MTSSADQPVIEPPVARVAIAVVGATVCTGLLASLICFLTGSVTLVGGMAATGVVVVGSLVGLVPMIAMGPRPVFSIASAVLFGSFLRMALALALGIAAYLGTTIDGKGFWFVFLAAAFAAMIGEVLAVTPVLRGEAGVQER